MLEWCAGTGELKFGWSNVCMHYFSTAFLIAMAERLKQQGQYHIAKKQIPSKDGPRQASPLLLSSFASWCLIGPEGARGSWQTQGNQVVDSMFCACTYKLIGLKTYMCPRLCAYVCNMWL